MSMQGQKKIVEEEKRSDVEGRARGSQTEARFGSGPHRDGRRQTSELSRIRDAVYIQTSYQNIMPSLGL